MYKGVKVLEICINNSLIKFFFFFLTLFWVIEMSLNNLAQIILIWK